VRECFRAIDCGPKMIVLQQAIDCGPTNDFFAKGFE
jgi:hypothetical protein